MKRSELHWLAVSLLVACTPTRGFLEIEQPGYWWRADDGLCGHNFVVDRDGTLWTEGGCETGPQELEKKTELSAEERAALIAAFERLPAETEAGAQCDGVRHQFSIGQRDQGRVWFVCVPRGDRWDPETVPEPYRPIVRLFISAR